MVRFRELIGSEGELNRASSAILEVNRKR